MDFSDVESIQVENITVLNGPNSTSATLLVPSNLVRRAISYSFSANEESSVVNLNEEDLDGSSMYRVNFFILVIT